MEKCDVIREVCGNGCILLHDKVEEQQNAYSIVLVWENVSEEYIITPGDVFNPMKEGGYLVPLKSGESALISDVLLYRGTPSRRIG
jgi:hypothetical protein